MAYGRRGVRVFAIDEKDEVEADRHEKLTEDDERTRRRRPSEAMVERRDDQDGDEA